MITTTTLLLTLIIISLTKSWTDRDFPIARSTGIYPPTSLGPLAMLNWTRLTQYFSVNDDETDDKKLKEDTNSKDVSVLDRYYEIDRSVLFARDFGAVLRGKTRQPLNQLHKKPPLNVLVKVTLPNHPRTIYEAFVQMSMVKYAKKSGIAFQPLIAVPAGMDLFGAGAISRYLGVAELLDYGFARAESICVENTRIVRKFGQEFESKLTEKNGSRSTIDLELDQICSKKKAFSAVPNRYYLSDIYSFGNVARSRRARSEKNSASSQSDGDPEEPGRRKINLRRRPLIQHREKGLPLAFVVEKFAKRSFFSTFIDNDNLTTAYNAYSSDFYEPCNAARYFEMEVMLKSTVIQLVSTLYYGADVLFTHGNIRIENIVVEDVTDRALLDKDWIFDFDPLRQMAKLEKQSELMGTENEATGRHLTTDILCDAAISADNTFHCAQDECEKYEGNFWLRKIMDGECAVPEFRPTSKIEVGEEMCTAILKSSYLLDDHQIRCISDATARGRLRREEMTLSDDEFDYAKKTAHMDGERPRYSPPPPQLRGPQKPRATYYDNSSDDGGEGEPVDNPHDGDDDDDTISPFPPGFPPESFPFTVLRFRVPSSATRNKLVKLIDYRKASAAFKKKMYGTGKESAYNPFVETYRLAMALLKSKMFAELLEHATRFAERLNSETALAYTSHQLSTDSSSNSGDGDTCEPKPVTCHGFLTLEYGPNFQTNFDVSHQEIRDGNKIMASVGEIAVMMKHLLGWRFMPEDLRLRIKAELIRLGYNHRSHLRDFYFISALHTAILHAGNEVGVLMEKWIMSRTEYYDYSEMRKVAECFQLHITNILLLPAFNQYRVLPIDVEDTRPPSPTRFY